MVTFAIWREDDKFVSKCLELDVASQGDTEEQALDRIKEASTLYLNTLEDLGECEQVLQEKRVPIHDTRVSVGPPIRPPRGRAASVRSAVLEIPAACA